ncbi:MAG: hypothetical protein E7516_03995 [Ruminococcaceae bacterium]|nr:hypothetical protein [Oscillospiraceae bacterium]
MGEKWVQTWGQAHSALSFFYYPSCPKTYRMVIKSAVSGSQVRIELSNECAKNPVLIGALSVAKCDENGNLTGEAKRVTVKGQGGFWLKIGQTAVTDPVKLDIGVNEYFCVSAYVKKGALRSGNLIDNVDLITVKGNAVAEKYITNQRRIRDGVREVASKVLKMYFHKPIPLFQSVELLNGTGATAITVFGDSISQQGYWTNAFAERIRNEFPGRYSVINKSIMGNRILRDFSRRFICKGLFGISGINRLERDVLNYDDTEYVIFVLGTNDFLQYGTITTPKSEKPTAREALDGVISIGERLAEKGKKFVVFNVLNFGECIDSRPEKEKLVHEYNRLLEENKHLFYSVYDQASVCVNPEKPNCSKKEYLGKDNLHPNKLGGKLVADNIDLNIFR